MRRATLNFLISIIFAAIGLFLISMIITPFLTTSLSESSEAAALTRIERTILYTLHGLQGSQEATIIIPKNARLTITTPSAACSDAETIRDEDPGVYLILTTKQATRMRIIPLSTIRDTNPHVTSLDSFCTTLTSTTTIRISLTDGTLTITP